MCKKLVRKVISINSLCVIDCGVIFFFLNDLEEINIVKTTIIIFIHYTSILFFKCIGILMHVNRND